MGVSRSALAAAILLLAAALAEAFVFDGPAYASHQAALGDPATDPVRHEEAQTWLGDYAASPP